MKICKRAVEFVQIIDAEGAVRQCAWLKDGGIIGYLTKNSMEEIYSSDEARTIREMHLNGDYSNCNPNQCPYVASNNFEKVNIDIDEYPKYPDTLYLAYENICNYRCNMCIIPGCMNGVDAKELEKKYNIIDDEVRKILPHVKHIGANGMGELFVSKHILQLLSEWKPLADPKEIQVELETNGSLFDEEHWKKIEHLGQYYLYVAITVLSFDDKIYRELSGTKQPVSKLIDNLNFVKSLREKGIINHLQLATVYQNANYKQLPDFVDRCLNEFGADTVRLRPFEPWGEVGMKEWLMDVRNVNHPNHEDFLDVMKNPIFENPKVLEWGGGRESGLGPEPYIKTRKMFWMLNDIFCDEKYKDKIRRVSLNKPIVIYGMGVVGKALLCRLKDDFNITYCLDRNMDGKDYMGIPICGINNLDKLDKDVTVLISLHSIEETIIKMLREAGYNGVITGISELNGDVKQ